MQHKKIIKNECRHKFYNNGAHAGNIIYTIESWGMNGTAKEIVIKQHLDEFISRLDVGFIKAKDVENELQTSQLARPEIKDASDIIGRVCGELEYNYIRSDFVDLLKRIQWLISASELNNSGFDTRHITENIELTIRREVCHWIAKRWQG